MGPRSRPLGFLPCSLSTSRRVDTLVHRGHHHWLTHPSFHHTLPTYPFSHSLPSSATGEEEPHPPPKVTTYSNGLNTTRITDKVALYWLKSRLACRLNSAHLIGAEPGQLVPTGQTPREMTAAVA